MYLRRLSREGRARAARSCCARLRYGNSPSRGHDPEGFLKIRNAAGERD
jgi:hypothetical protein